MTLSRIFSSVDLPAPWADEHDALAALGLEVEVAVDDVVAVGLLDVFQRDDLQAGARRLREAEIDLLEVLPRLLDGDFLEALDLFLLRLGARSHRGLGAEAVDEFLEVGDLALLVLEESGLLLATGVLFVEVVVVVAGVFVERAALELEDAVAECVQEFAVVRNDEQATRIARQVVLEPEQRFEIEVVRRLVEQEQRGLADEQAGEVRAHDPAAGE